jgi:hypothetical protein
MDWLRDATTRWVRIIGAAHDGDRTPLDEAVQQINALGGTPGKKGGLGRLKRGAAAQDEVPAATILSRQLIAGVLVSDVLIDRLGTLAGQTREQVLDQLPGEVSRQLPDQQLRALQGELSDACRLLRDPDRGSYDKLGGRVEQLLALAEEQARTIVDEARAEAARIASSAGAQPPGPRSDGSDRRGAP